MIVKCFNIVHGCIFRNDHAILQYYVYTENINIRESIDLSKRLIGVLQKLKLKSYAPDCIEETISNLKNEHSVTYLQLEALFLVQCYKLARSQRQGRNETQKTKTCISLLFEHCAAKYWNECGLQVILAAFLRHRDTENVTLILEKRTTLQIIKSMSFVRQVQFFKDLINAEIQIENFKGCDPSDLNYAIDKALFQQKSFRKSNLVSQKKFVYDKCNYSLYMMLVALEYKVPEVFNTAKECIEE